MQEYHLDGKSLEKGSCNRNFLQNTKKVTPKAFKDAFLSVPVSAGTHTIQFSYLPEGLIPGIVLFVLCTGGFVAYVTLIPARRNRKKEDK